MVIKKINEYGEKWPFENLEFIPETEEERYDLCIKKLCDDIRSYRAAILVEKDILDKAIQRDCLKNYTLLRVNANDVRCNTHDKAGWVSDLYKQTSDEKHIVLVFDIPDGFDDEYIMRCLIVICKDRVFIVDKIPDNVSIIITVNSYVEIRERGRRSMNELLGVCIPVVKKRFPIETVCRNNPTCVDQQ